jgi:hypothetical protein
MDVGTKELRNKTRRYLWMRGRKAWEINKEDK